jgi:hypothetical protein
MAIHQFVMIEGSMIPKNFALVLFFALTITFLTTACQSIPGFRIFTGREANQDGPQAVFVSSQAVIQATVGQHVPLETFYTSPAKLKTAVIKINNQSLTFNRAGGLLLAPYPPTQDEAPSSVEATCNSNHLAVLQISPETIQLTDTVTLDSLPAKFPNSTWPVLVTWQGCVPGTYNLSIAATDTADRMSQLVTQRIEIK